MPVGQPLPHLALYCASIDDGVPSPFRLDRREQFAPAALTAFERLQERRERPALSDGLGQSVDLLRDAEQVALVVVEPRDRAVRRERVKHAVDDRHNHGRPEHVTTDSAEHRPIDTINANLQAVRTDRRAALVIADSRTRKRTLTRGDRERLARIVPAVGGVFGSELFAIRELFAHPAPALRIALQGETAKGCGRLFQRAGGSTLPGGYTIRAEGRELNAALWRILQVDGFLT